MANLDLAAPWNDHCRCKFETRGVDATIATMTDDPYVSHIATMTGSIRHDQPKRFYRHHFIGANPENTRLIPINFNVGAHSLILHRNRASSKGRSL